MKKVLIIFLVLLANISYKKENAAKETYPVLVADATVQRVPFACGPACDATAWIVVVDDTQEGYLPRQLAADFQVYNHPVKITFKKTGEKPCQYQGPSLEYIDIIDIQHRQR